jgi:hypothetical protein
MSQLNEDWLPSIRQNFSKMPTAELAAIYARHDTDEWSPEAFHVIREIFCTRGNPLPAILPPEQWPFREQRPLPNAASAKRTGTLSNHFTEIFVEAGLVEPHGPKPVIRSVSILGIGTTFIGQSDFRSDGSYVTTQWFCVFIPLFPLRSLRVRDVGPGRWNPLMSSEHYTVLAVTPPNGEQVLLVYGFPILYIAWLCFLLCVGLLLYPVVLKDQNIAFFAFATAGLVPLSIPLILRRRSQKKAGLR